MRILVCPLNWGLGHATRSGPIIDGLVARGHEVHLASDGLAQVVLIKAYPALPMHSLAPLSIEYGKAFWMKLFSQFFPFVFWLIKDHTALSKLHGQYNFDIVISDSRPTCYLNKVYSVFITNQPSPIVPTTIIRWMVRSFLKIFSKNFNEIWIPDLIGDINLSGDLIKLPSKIKAKYLGLLSRMSPPNEAQNGINEMEVLAIVSGPEPMRSDFETQLKSRLKNVNAVIVGGRPNVTLSEESKYLSYLDPTDLAKHICKAKFIINRGGYSSLMDLAAFNKHLILVPTPGQSEQNYLAHRLQSFSQAVIWDMDRESWESVKERAEDGNPFYLQNDESLLNHTLDQLESTSRRNSYSSTRQNMIVHHWVFG